MVRQPSGAMDEPVRGTRGVATTSGKRATSGAGLSRGAAFAALALANVLWAGTYAAGKIALGELSPVMLNAMRFTLAALLLSPVLLHERARIRAIVRSRSDLLTLGMLIMLGWVLNKFFEYIGLALSTASDVALLISTESLFTAALSWSLLRERVTRLGVAALGVGMLGAYLVVARGLIPTLGASDGVNNTARIVGDLLVMLALFVEALYTIRGKSVLSRWPPLFFTTLTITGSLIFWLPAGAVAVAEAGWPRLTLSGWLSIGYMAVFSTVVAYWLWFRGLTVFEGSAAAPMLFIQPLLGTLLAIWLLGDCLTWATVAGGALILVSMILVLRGGAGASAPEAEAALVEPSP
jgi:drug/metabolite transporter (DMT)-like permease